MKLPVYLEGRPDLTPYLRSRILPLLSKALILGRYDCWIWQACLNSTGYGQFKLEGRRGHGQISTPANRASYILFVADLAPGQHACHDCDNRLCINPYHLFAGTQLQNMQDMISKGRAPWQQVAA